MTILANRTFQNETVELDGHHFVDCKLLNCNLEYHGGDIVFERTEMRGCRHCFFGRARQTLRYLQETGLMPRDPMLWSEHPVLLQ